MKLEINVSLQYKRENGTPLYSYIFRPVNVLACREYDVNKS